uniref:Putative ovule protein n=1 Tax=Solanum chacoense TaxID=4108 RepID=A0A0V0HCJ8_SOLCH
MWCFDGSNKFQKKLYFILCLYIIHLSGKIFGCLNLFWTNVLVLIEGKVKTNLRGGAILFSYHSFRVMLSPFGQ